MQVRFERRSDLRPTRIRGVEGQKCRTSGYHCGLRISIVKHSGRKVYLRTLSIIFSRLAGQSIAKQTNRRSVSGYDRGRNLSYSSWPAVSHNASSTVLPEALCVV